ncbi:MAG: hypothetical protein U0900_19710 [Myxococcota bacterium]
MRGDPLGPGDQLHRRALEHDAAVDRQDARRHEARRRRREEERGLRDVGRRAVALERGPRLELLADAGDRVEQAALHVLGRDRTDPDRIDPDPRRVLHRHHPRQLFEGRLRAAVGDRADVRGAGEARRDVDDRAAAHAHVGRHRPRQVEGRLEVEVEGRLEVVVLRVLRRDVSPAARVVDEHVDPPEGGERLLDDPIGRVARRQIAVDRDRAPAGGLDRRLRPVELRARARDAGDLRADLREGPRDLRTDPAPRAGHDRDLPVESECVEDQAPPLRAPCRSCVCVRVGIRTRGSA